MSNEVHYIEFNEGRLRLEMRFEGDGYENASVKFKLEAKDGRPTLNESPAIPVKCLFDMAYLIDVSVRRNAILLEQELRRMEKFSKETNQELLDIGGLEVLSNKKENKDDKKDQAK